MSGADKSDCASWCGLAADHDGACELTTGQLREIARKADEVEATFGELTFAKKIFIWAVDDDHFELTVQSLQALVEALRPYRDWLNSTRGRPDVPRETPKLRSSP